MRLHYPQEQKANWLFRDGGEYEGDEWRASQWQDALTEGCKCHSGDVLMKGSACTTREAIILFSLARAPPGRRAAHKAGRSSAESSPRKPDGERTGCLDLPSPNRQSRAPVCPHPPYPGGHEEEATCGGGGVSCGAERSRLLPKGSSAGILHG